MSEVEMGEPEGTEFEETRELPSLPVRVGQLLFAPGELFRALRDRPVWLGAMLLAIALAVTMNALVPVELWEQGTREAMLRMESSATLDTQGLGSIQKWSSVGAAVIFTPISMAVVAGGLMVIFMVLLGDEGSYRQYLSVVAHAWLILMIGALLVLPLRILQGDLTLSLHLGLFFPFLEGFWSGFLRAFDLFSIWHIIVLAIGMNALDERRSVGSALTIFVFFQALIATGVGIFLAR